MFNRFAKRNIFQNRVKTYCTNQTSQFKNKKVANLELNVQYEVENCNKDNVFDALREPLLNIEKNGAKIIKSKFISLFSPRLVELTEEIKNISSLEHLFAGNKSEYYSGELIVCKDMSHLQKCVLETGKCKILEEYINLYLDEHPEELNYKNARGMTALMLAALHSDTISTNNTVEILLKHGANVDIQDNNGKTALMHAAKHVICYSSVKTIKLLLAHNANVNLQDITDWTAIMHSLSPNNSPTTSKLLLDHGADINLMGIGDVSVLYLCFYGNVDDSILEAVLEKLDHCDVKIRGKKLIKCIKETRQSQDMIDIALKKGAKFSDM